MNLKRFWLRRGHYGSPIGIALFLLPALIPYTFLMLYPTLQTFGYSVVKWQGIIPDWSAFDGFTQFGYLFRDPIFWIGLANCARASLLGILFTMPVAMALAYVLTRHARAAGLFRTIYYLPSVVPGVMLAFMWRFIFSKAINPILEAVGLSAVRWLSRDGVVQWSTNFPWAWRGVGFWVVILMAGMASVPRELYEAAQLDGAGELQLVRHVTLPSIWGLFITANITVLSGALGTFIFQRLMTEGGPNDRTHTLVSYLVSFLTRGSTAAGRIDWGFASALAAVQFSLSATVAGVLLWLRGRTGED
jgi:raffinose/stachyose/melibiose transport system permease protein